MAWKFLNIGKANSEIERLSAEVASLTKERDEARTALETNHAEMESQLGAANKSMEGLNSQVAGLTAERDRLQADLQTSQAELKEAREKLANPPAQIIEIAAHRAAEITGAQGQPPISTSPAGTPAGGSSKAGEAIMAQYQAIKDPAARTAFWQKNRKAILAASAAERS